MRSLGFLWIAATLRAATLVGAETNTSPAAAAFEAQCQSDLVKLEARFAELEKIEGPKTVATVLEPLNDFEIAIGGSARLAGLYFNVHPDADVRAVAKAHRQNISKLGGKLSTSVAINDALKQVVPPKDADTRRLIEHLTRDYRRSGVDQPEATRERVRTLIEEITLAGQTFSENISSDVRFIELDSAAELAGLPADYITAHPPGDDGKIRITTNYPDYVPFMRYAQSEARRRELQALFANRGYPANEEALKSILIKRHELATLLGYENYADYVAEVRMIGSDERIAAFIDQIALIARPRAEREYAELLDRWKQIDPTAEKVAPWNSGHVAEIIRREKYEVDAKKVRSYFQFGPARDGILELTSRMFGVTYRRWDTETWHEDVVAYEMLEDGKVIGRFYFDLHPRENKFKHAAHFSLLDGVAGRQIPTSALVCNFPGKGDEGALMEHSQVITFLHEFGHLLHHLFGGQQRWAYFSGIATERDFVEAPSQMLEEWIWNADALQLISENKQGEPIPDELLAKMVAARDFGAGLRASGQMSLAALSLNYYNRNPATIDLDAIMIEQREKYSLYEHTPGTHMYANFGHLYGYSAGYYTYMWSRVISKDLLSRFQAEGMLNQNVTLAYRDAILTPGGSKDAADLVEDFLGRPYDFEPFANWLNGGSDDSIGR